MNSAILSPTFDKEYAPEMRGDDMRDDENLLQYRVRMIEKRVAKCGVYRGGSCDCGHPFVNHPAK